MMEALKIGGPLPAQNVVRPFWEKPLRVHAVPPPKMPLPFLKHPRLRRTSAITQYAIGAAHEALGDDVASVQNGDLRVGVIVCLMPGCVEYSRRFYEEVMHDPVMASPLIFPETVFNAPASHISAYLNSTAAYYTLVGDNGTFLQGVALAATWLEDGMADACLVVGAEETDWIAADAVRLFRRGMVYSGGAGALYLKKIPGTVELQSITDSFLFTTEQGRAASIRKMNAQLPPIAADELLCVNETENSGGPVRAGKCLIPGRVLGDSFVAMASWQCVAACDFIRRGEFRAANVGIVGANQQAIGARFIHV
jgi:hypothetical protein